MPYVIANQNEELLYWETDGYRWIDMRDIRAAFRITNRGDFPFFREQVLIRMRDEFERANRDERERIQLFVNQFIEAQLIRLNE